MNIVCLTIDDTVLGDNKPIWMQAEEREENKVSLLFSWLNMTIHVTDKLLFEYVIDLKVPNLC